MVQAMYSADISSQHAGCLALRRALSKGIVDVTEFKLSSIFDFVLGSMV